MPQAFNDTTEHFYRGDRRNEREDRDQTDLVSKAKKKNGKKAKRKPEIGANSYAPGAAEMLASILRKPLEQRSSTVLDEFIYGQSLADVPFGKTAAHLKMPVEEVRKRYFELLNERNGGTPEQMRMHLLAQLKTIVNSMQEAATNGSVDHVKMWILAIERTSKLLDLEAAKAGVTFNIITTVQTEIVMNVVNFVVAAIKEAPELSKVIDPMVLDATVAGALGRASEFLYESTDKQIDAAGQPV